MHGMKEDELNKVVREGKAVLLDTREGRIRPGLDDKILTSWNALMLRGYVHAYRAFRDEKFLTAALRNADFLFNNAISRQNDITRNYKEGKATISGFLDDYAFTISALIELYQATFDEKWLNEANHLTDYTIEHFFDENSGMFFYTHTAHSDLIARKMEISDNVIPGSNSEMAKNMFQLGHYFYNDDYISKARQMLVNVLEDVNQNIFYYSNWGILEAYLINPPHEIAILGSEHESVRISLDEHYLPFVLLSGGANPGNLKHLQNKLVPGQTTIYVCRDKVCKLPVINVPEALDQIKN